MDKNYKEMKLLAIGDTVVNAFIRLKDAHVYCNLNKKECELCLRFGDKIPYESVTILPAVGNSANASICASRLGLSVALMTNVGNDQYGKDCINKLMEEKIETDFVEIEPGKKTNYHYILWYDTERTILVKHENFNREWKNIEISQKPKWIYLSSMGEDSLDFHNQILSYLNKNPGVKLAFQPGTYQIKFGTEKLKEIYYRTDSFFCNKEEAQKILNSKETNILNLSKEIASLGPKNVFISDAENGAYLYENENLWYLPIYTNDKSPFERTGAGDAFSSTIVSYMAKNMSPVEAFKRGQINSMSVIQYIGPHEGLLSYEKLEEYLKNAPENYKLIKIN